MHAAPGRRSLFVTLTGVIALCCSTPVAYSAFIEVVSGRMSTFTTGHMASWEEWPMTPEEKHLQDKLDALADQPIPPMKITVAAAAPLLLASSLGLLLRRNWARLLFVFSLAALVLLCGYFLFALAGC